KITTVQDDGVLDSGWYRLGCSLGVWWTGWHPRNNYLVNIANRRQNIDKECRYLCKQ
ncbi:8870_t:CDS:1, partial [Paraglomus occultum]